METLFPNKNFRRNFGEGGGQQGMRFEAYGENRAKEEKTKRVITIMAATLSRGRRR